MKSEMIRLLGALFLVSLVKAQDNMAASTSPLTSVVALTDIPQFVMISVTDPASEFSMRAFRPLTEIRNQFGCGIKATFFVTPTNDTTCQFVQALRQGEHEIAGASTINPPAEEIAGNLAFLGGCGLSTDELRGYRAPYTAYSFETLQSMFSLQLLYDSSIALPDNALAAFGSNNLWPFTFDGVGYGDIGCQCLNATLPGLWEIPLGPMYGLDNTVLNPVDFSTENVYEILNQNFQRRYSGNKAPLHIPLTWSWMANNNFQLKRWIEDTNAAYSDVFFVTISDVINYMRSPVSSSLYRTQCNQGDCYTPIPKDCVFGDFDYPSCSCTCSDGYCLDDGGTCTVSSGCGDIDGNWSDWDSSGPCCGGMRMENRSCTNPQPAGNGAECEGESLRSVACSPSDCANSGWSDWGEYDDCCEGKQAQTRECLASPDVGCIGNATQEIACSPDVCDIKYYPDYSTTTCVLTGRPPEGVDPTLAYNGYEDCCNDNFDFAAQKCISAGANPPVDGGWSEWSEAGPCCDSERLLTRTCTNPAPANDGAECEGSDRLVQNCTSATCENGGWSEWTEFGECCNGKETRTRQCLKVSPDCEGDAEETLECSKDNCSVFYSPNFNKQICVKVSDPDEPPADALLTEQFSNPEDCCNEHFSWTVTTCLEDTIEPVDGGWSEWGEYTSCCRNTMTRFRACTNPAPQNGGLGCEGEATETVECFENLCDIPDSASGKVVSSLLAATFGIIAALVGV